MGRPSEDTIKRVAKAIFKKPKTARQIAEEVGISKIAVYAALKAAPALLKPMGWTVSITMVRDGTTGPEARAFFMTPLRR